MTTRDLASCATRVGRGLPNGPLLRKWDSPNSAACFARHPRRRGRRRTRKKSASLAESFALPADDGRDRKLRKIQQPCREHTRARPATYTRNFHTEPPLVSVPSKSNAATTLPGVPDRDPLSSGCWIADAHERGAIRDRRCRAGPLPSEKRDAPSAVSPLAIVERPRQRFVYERVVLGKAPLVEKRSSVVSHAYLRERSDLPGQVDRDSKRLAMGSQAVDETHRQGLGSADSASGEEQVEGVALADQAGEPDRPTVDQGHAEPPAVHAEHGVSGRHAQVAPKGELEPTGNGVALDRGDDGLREVETGRAHRARAVVADRPPVTFGHRLQVGTCAERAPGARSGPRHEAESSTSNASKASREQAGGHANRRHCDAPGVEMADDRHGPICWSPGPCPPIRPPPRAASWSSTSAFSQEGHRAG